MRMKKLASTGVGNRRHQCCCRIFQSLSRRFSTRTESRVSRKSISEHLIKNKSTASGGETPKGSAVSGVHLSHRDLGHMNGTSFGRRLWDCGTRVSAARLDEYPSRRCIHEQAKLQRDEDQGGSNFDSTQRPLQGAFLIPPVLPVVLICCGKMPSLRRAALPGSFNLPKQVRMSPSPTPTGR